MITSTDNAANTFFASSFARTAIRTYRKEGCAHLDAKQLAADLLFVDVRDDDQLSSIACDILRVDTEVMEEFLDMERLEAGFASMIEYQGLNSVDAIGAGRVFYDCMPGLDPTWMLLCIIDDFYDVHIQSPESRKIQRAFWKGHGMGHDISKLYPYYTARSPIPRAVKEALEAGILTVCGPGHKVDRITRVEVTHDIYACILTSDVSPVDGVWDALEGVYFHEMSVSLRDNLAGRQAASDTFWRSLGFSTDENHEPLIPDL